MVPCTYKQLGVDRASQTMWQLCLFFGSLPFPLYSQIGSEYAVFTAFFTLALLLHGDQNFAGI